MLVQKKLSHDDLVFEYVLYVHMLKNGGNFLYNLKLKKSNFSCFLVPLIHKTARYT